MSQLQIKLTALSAKLLTFSFYIKLGNTFQGNIFFPFFVLGGKTTISEQNVSE